MGPVLPRSRVRRKRVSDDSATGLLGSLVVGDGRLLRGRPFGVRHGGHNRHVTGLV